MRANSVEIEHLNVAYGTHAVLENASLEVKKRRVLSGCWKKWNGKNNLTKRNRGVC